jgi:hypothetical protein
MGFNKRGEINHSRVIRESTEKTLSPQSESLRVEEGTQRCSSSIGGLTTEIAEKAQSPQRESLRGEKENTEMLFEHRNSYCGRIVIKFSKSELTNCMRTSKRINI